MSILNKIRKLACVLLLVFLQFVFIPVKQVNAASGASPSLGNADSFAVLGGTAITNVPTSVITGDVGLSPDAGSNYSGLTNSEVSGTIFAVDASGPAGSSGNNPTLVNNAKTDLVTAYNALAAGANADVNCDASYVFGAGNKDLSGASLPPGVYCADTFTLTGTLTLTGSGVWVFRSAATLVTSGTANIVGGDSCSVWWQVPSSATLGTNTSLKGNILALTSITLNTGASLIGRVLARNGAVTLGSNTITQSCSAVASAVAVSSTDSTTTRGGGTAPFCPPLSNQVIVPRILSSRRVDPTSIFLSWGPYSGTDIFNIQYGTTNGNWIYNTDATGFSTTINSLPNGSPIWVRIAPRTDCTIGMYGAAKFIGGPGLPNTGHSPVGSNIICYVLLGIVTLAFASLALSLKRGEI